MWHRWLRDVDLVHLHEGQVQMHDPALGTSSVVDVPVRPV